MNATRTVSTRSARVASRQVAPAASRSGSQTLLIAALTLVATGVSFYDLLLLAVAFH